MEYAAEQGFGWSMTCKRDQLPGGIPDKYFHKEKTNKQNSRTRAARWEVPIFAVKKLTMMLSFNTSAFSLRRCATLPVLMR